MSCYSRAVSLPTDATAENINVVENKTPANLFKPAHVNISAKVYDNVVPSVNARNFTNILDLSMQMKHTDSNILITCNKGLYP